MVEERLEFFVGDKQLSAIFTRPDGPSGDRLLIYAPGAGSNINDPFGKYLAGRLATSGYSTVRFQFPYMEAGKRRPDSPKLLEETWREIIGLTRPAGGKLVVGGRSMGGRIASHIVAQGIPVDGLALFAYPLQPPSNPSNTRDEHLPRITVPTLFCSGTRDTFGTPDQLRAAASKVAKARVHLLEGADHGFTALKSTGRTKEEVWQEATDSLLSWLHEAVDA